MDIISITAIIGAITGCAALIWNIITYSGFDLEICTHFLSVEYKEKINRTLLTLSMENKDISNYSDNAIFLKGWFKLLLRKEGQRYRNHHINIFTIDLEGEIKEFLANITADFNLHIPLFCNEEIKDLKLFEGLPLKINVHSNPLLLKKDWKGYINLDLDQFNDKLDELIAKEEYKINVGLTTYKYPFTYEKKDNFKFNFFWLFY
jgi:hypothetical protein